jgi:cyclopropane fatty-acyl-phospholipid synthase-like methyltransferase
MKPDWYYDDLRQVGVDFADARQVESYDRRQQDDPAAARKLLEGLGLEAGQRFADIGCGTGVLAVEAAKIGAVVTAIDISPAMLAAVERRAAAEEVALKTEQAGFLSLDPGMEPLDLVTSCFAFHHLPDFWKAEALARLKGLIAPGGRLFLRDVIFSCAPAEIGETVEAWAAYMRENTGYRRDEVATHVREEHSTFDWIVEGLLERAGYRILKTEAWPPVYRDYLAAPIA